MSYRPRKMLTIGESRKVKEREFPFFFSPSPTSPKPLINPTSVKAPNRRTMSFKETQSQQQQTAPARLSSNRHLAGYMAYEFLTKGTLLGKRLAEGKPEPVQAGSGSLKKAKTESEPEPVAYAELSRLLMSGEAHVPDVVNPSQLATWIQM